MTRKLFVFIASLLWCVVGLGPQLVFAQDNTQELEILADPGQGQVLQEEFYRARVISVLDERAEDFGVPGQSPVSQELEVEFLSGLREGEREVIRYGVLNREYKLEAGDDVIVVVPQNVGSYVFDRYRLPALGFIALLFTMLAVVFAGWRGLTSLAGLGVSVIVLAAYVVPHIMDGKNPLVVSLVGSFVIAITSLYLAHGFNRRTTIALAGTLITVVFAIVLAQVFVSFSGLTGMGSEEAYHLQASPAGFVNLKGLLLGGVIIGALGVLDDITTSQTAAVFEIWRANPALSRRELFRRGQSVGREHITSLINTLALAYVGASLPALLLFSVYQRPWWVVMNTETIAEEIIRTLVGSVALMLAVPVTTALAAWWLSNDGQKESPDA